MVDVNDYVQEKSCTYKGEIYSVRDNGAVMRITPEGKRPRPLDGYWNFGTKNPTNGYMTIGGHRVHIIVATAFYGERNSKVYVVDHIDTNRCNNRVENLRWLTKLENILLNEFTRQKIESICGSVENFLENPSLLRGYEYQDKNFEWMRTVSKEEAENTLKSWKTLFEKPRVKTVNGQTIGEWIYGNQSSLHDSLFKTAISEKSAGQFETEENREEYHTEELRPSMEHERLKQEQQRLARIQEKHEEQKAQNREKTAIKRLVKESVLSVATANGWTVEKNSVGNGWKADLLVSCNDYHIGIKLFASTRNIYEELKSMEADSVKGYWLGSCCNELYPCFELIISESGPKVKISETICVSIEQLLKAVISGHLQIEDEIIVNKVKVRFVPIDCYWCHTTHYYYFVNGVVFQGIPSLETTSGMYSADISVDCFEPIIVEGVKRYLSQHPELNYPMGEIKERYSKTRNESYLSFGCPECDGLLGDWYLNDGVIDYNYEPDDEFVHLIDLPEPGLKLHMPHWVIK